MKKLIAMLFVLILVSPVVFAATRRETQDKAETPDALSQSIQERQQEMTREMTSMEGEEKVIYQRQNRVRLAVHALLAMEDLAGEVGPRISQVAREFDSSVQATIRAEEKIQTRSALARFFAGGDSEAAEDIESKVTQNRERIQELQQLREECTNSEVRAMMQEQIQNMQNEQTRLNNLAKAEQKSKGLLGWLWK